jgi:two-component system, chemotaxis family, sensor kinase CheA
MSDKLIDTFLAEANELVVDIERSLLELNGNADNQESISSIFRAMHTLKGAAGMFQFELVMNLTHHLENIYQEIRDGKRTLDEEIVQVTFRTLDQLRVLLEGSPQMAAPAGYQELHEAITNLASGSNGASIGTIESKSGSLPIKTYYIRFEPAMHILRNGTNPLYLVDDLLVLGSGISLPFFNDLPSLEDLSPDLCYLGFEVLLATDKSVEEIQSVFLFVESDCEVLIRELSSEHILKDLTQAASPFLNRDKGSPLGFDFVNTSVHRPDSSRGAQIANKVNKSKTGNIRVSSDRLDELMNLVSELVTTQARLSLFSNQNSSPELSAISENIENITRRLRDNAFTMSLVPLESIAVRFQRLVNDLSKELNKRIEFHTDGLETMIDKSIIEKLTDPILHILRNCIDHGIEHEEARVRNGKAPVGIVRLRSYYSGSNVIIEIGDDGAGLALDKIKNKAVSQGLISVDATLSPDEISDLIFLPGFSTATTITGVSGRGVGMDVVRRNIADIQGEVEVHSIENRGSNFVIRFPITLSILDGLLVKVGETSFILPLSIISKCFEVETEKLESTFNSWVTLDGTRTPFIFLRKEFGIQGNKPAYSQIINVPYNGSTVGLAVDKIVGEYQAVLKPLGKFYLEQDEFSGATILGDGTVSLVLDTNKLIRKVSA